MSFTSGANNIEIKTSDETNSSLNELFKVVYEKPSCRQKPLNERQLPRSFFVQPTGSSASPTCSHFKAFSSPATLEETYRAGPGSHVGNHYKQRSLDYPNNHQPYSEFNNISNVNLNSHSPSVESKPHLDIEVKKLPDGFEMALNEKCQVYFLNHNTKMTTWFDPRLPESMQKWGMTLSDLQEIHIQYMNHLSSRHASAQKQPAISLLRSPNQSLSGSLEQTHTFTDPKAQIHFRSCSQPVSSSGASLGGGGIHDSTILSFQMTTGQPVTNMQYFVNHSNNGGGSAINNYQELCRLYPHCSSSVQESRSHSNNSSCSNLSTCLNGLNLSPNPLSSNSVLMNQSAYAGHLSPSINIATHSHQDSLDSGVGQSVVSQNQQSSNVPNSDEQNAVFDLPLKKEDNCNIENCFEDKYDEFMDFDI